MNMSPQDRDTALELKRRILAAGVPLVRLTVFGSRARGDAQEDSDLDVLVVTDEDSRETERRVWRCAWDLEDETGVFIHAVVKSRHRIEETYERASLFMMGIAEDGVPV